MIQFTLPIRPVTKKNSGQIIQVKGRAILIPSKNYLEFEKRATPYLKAVLTESGQIDYPVNVKCLFYTETRRKVDLANLLNAIDDAAVKVGLFLDDNRDIVAAHDGSRVFCDPSNPRVEVTITELKEYTQWKDTTSKQQRLL